MITFQVNVSGPIFRPAVTEQFMREYANGATQAVAEVGLTDVVTLEKASFRDPTPHYWTRTQIERPSNTQARSINDDNVIYGPWLEGISGRNATTRFKGYAMYRRAGQALQRKAPAIANGVLPRYLGRIS